MILLIGSDVLQVVTGSTGTVKVHATWKETTCNWASRVMGETFYGRNNPASITTATTTAVIAAPGVDVSREVSGVVIRNAHASTSNLVTVQHTDGTTVVPVWRGTLAAGETAIYDNGVWTHYDTDGYAITATGTAGAAGADGAAGAAGAGVPAGGTTAQQLRKKSNTDYDTEWFTP